MDYKELADAVRMCGSTPKVEQCQKCPFWAGGNMMECIPRMTSDAATAIETFRGEIAKLKDSRDRWKKCAENFSAGVEQRDREDDALQEENEKLRADLDRVTAERDAAVKDMEALMWFSGEGCHICAHEIIIHKEPYVRSKCALGNCAACCPTWRGPQKED